MWLPCATLLIYVSACFAVCDQLFWLAVWAYSTSSLASGRDEQAPCEAWVPGFVTIGNPKGIHRGFVPAVGLSEKVGRLCEETLLTFVVEHPRVNQSRTC